jgi:hypothetical protein
MQILDKSMVCLSLEYLLQLFIRTKVAYIHKHCTRVKISLKHDVT